MDCCASLEGWLEERKVEALQEFRLYPRRRPPLSSYLSFPPFGNLCSGPTVAGLTRPYLSFS